MAIKPRTSYRPEIDGLRAVSVLGVLLFHAGLGFPGGYVGVDVFFVISGFLISGIILKDLNAGVFTLRRFWARRIRRIVPAVSAMVCLSLLAGYLLLEPGDFEDLAKSAIAQTLMYANIFFLNDSGYFSELSDYKPLLHTWTLAVEEQFYLFFPLLLALIYKLQKRRVFLILFAIAGISLAAGIYLIAGSPLECFYLLPVRAWELLAGALLAVAQHKINLSKASSEALAWTGLAMVFGAMFFFSAETQFPGGMALFPVLGASAFIASSCNHTPTAARILSTKPAVFIGLISYSLYLWHWPLFSFSKHVFIDVTFAIRMSLVVLSFALAYLSWRFIENPFRKGSWLASHKATFAFGASTVIVIYGSAQLIRSTDGVPQRFNAAHLALIEDIAWNGTEFLSQSGDPQAMGAHPTNTFVGSGTENTAEMVPDFVFWGDSHGLMLSNIVDRKASEYDFAGEAYLLSSRLPIPNLWRPSEPQSTIEECLEQNLRVKESILQRGVANVILVARWSVYCSGHNPLEGSDTAYLHKPLASDDAAMTVADNTPELASASIRRQLQKLVQELTDAGVRVWILKQVPETDSVKSARHFFQAQRFPFVELPDRYTITLAKHQQRQRHAETIFDGLQMPGLTVIDPAPPFFSNAEGRLHVFSDRSHYRDDDHLTRFGVDAFLEGTFDEIFAAMLE
jgi:peptidoglycan/LPS O-acetylase OafA/YrhL